ncbi:ABC transporter ATP-binding protein [Paucilactobacillus suebicus]|uniref:Bacitracin ABC transporter ATP-binding protein BcrA n=1 Tax=Paucilactobacillus suebicus DSM 5007 = KCTC 3549 TaxID=1423807 RepID=A0A0R1W3I6_9LACO|nr:ABC transporter ATP-binding protein [Paucilactobacillus suebicus]KRM12416.1 bacitracin ABC transporter ATP-binding protein BcrA [Paucilactobacillus suebicus DSM 5007 = KCTC 3549]
MENVIELHNVTKKFGKQTALNHVNLTIQRGDIYGLIGRNGAGKTTILKSIVKLIQPSAGEIVLFGQSDGTEYFKQLKRTGSVIETPVANAQLTARQNLKYYCKMKGIVDKNAVDEALKFVGLEDTGKKKFKNFSLGMKQKLGLAVAMLNKPDLLILDEPINGLDPIAIAEFRNLLIKLNQTQKMTILISSHILEELYQMATRFGIINNGEIIKEVTKEEFEEQSKAYIKLEIGEASDATAVLHQIGIDNFKVIDAHTINIYDIHASNNEIVKAMVTAQIEVQTIVKQHINLENYFKSIIESGGEQDA